MATEAQNLLQTMRQQSQPNEARDILETMRQGQQDVDQPSGGVDFSLSETISNIPGSAFQLGKDVVSAVTSPIETGGALLNVAGASLEKIGRKFEEFSLGEEIPPTPGKEDFANALGEAIKSRYGSLDAFKETVQTDPIGFISDVSGLAMSTKIPFIAKIGAAVEPIGAATSAVKSAVKAVIPENAAFKLYESAAKFSTTLKPAQREAMITTALSQGIMPTSKGVMKIEGKVDALNSSLNEFITVATESGAQIPVKAIFQHLTDLRKSKGGVRLGSEADVNQINKIAGSFHRSLKGRETVTPEELQFFKTEAYKEIGWDAKRMAGTPIKEETFKTMARGAKDALVGEIPEAADINKLLGELLELQPHLVRAANRIDNRNIISINTPLNVGAGGMLGSVADATGIGVGAGLIASVLGNPKTKARLAIALNKMKAGDTGWIQSNIGSAEVRVALTLAGRAEQELN